MKEWWNKTVRDYFTFSTVERNGVVVLCLMILLVIFLPQLILLFHKDDAVNFEAFKEEVSSFQKRSANIADTDSSKSQPSLSELDEARTIPIKHNEVQLFSFDPNSATAGEFKKLGLNDRVIKTILNYRDKGGKFFSKEDFKKIYVLKEEDFDRLEPYIQIASEKKNSPALLASGSSPVVTPSSKNSVVDLNKTDSSHLVALPGIGSVLSSRIIKYRNKLGGFYSTDQLKEVYGLTTETFDEIKDKISVNASDVKQINLNNATFDELKEHPYFKSIAQILINYRDQHGDFKTVEDLKNIDVITDQTYKRIIPYTEF